MKGGKKYKKNILNTLDWIEYWNEFNVSRPDSAFIEVYRPNDFDLTLGDACMFLYALKRKYPDHISIVNIYDCVNDEHWESPPLYPDPQGVPVAELWIKTNISELKRAIEKDANINNLENKSNIKLFDKDITYDDTKAKINIGGKECPLPIAKNEDYLANAMFKRPIGEPVDWSILYNEINGSEEIGNRQNQKSVQDTVNRLNKRIQEIIGTDDKLLSWENKSVIRNF